jgi:hypothetical protein
LQDDLRNKQLRDSNVMMWSARSSMMGTGTAIADFVRLRVVCVVGVLLLLLLLLLLLVVSFACGWLRLICCCTCLRTRFSHLRFVCFDCALVVAQRARLSQKNSARASIDSSV